MSREVNALPYEVHRELCRILDNGEEWRELAGRHMKYSVFDINEIANESRQYSTSPTRLLLQRWGHQIHSTNELFVLLYRMRHVPAMRCVRDCVDPKCLLLLNKLSASVPLQPDENANKIGADAESVTSIPLPVQEIGKEQPPGHGVKRPPPTQSVQSPAEEVTSSENMTDSSSVANEEVMRCASSIPRIPHHELADATGGWAPENLLGNGGFGVVYKGEWKQTLVAIKRLKAEKKVSQEFIRELCLNGYRHDNLLPLYGYSVGGPGPCLVYQLMLGGSLELRLRARAGAGGLAPLTWPQRHKIALGTARGLQYLHFRTSTALIHGDIKPANILLDPCTEPKIGDFGLARIGAFGDDRTHVMVSKVQGTRHYLPPDFVKTHFLSPAVDVFSFGLVLAELATALRVYDKARGDEAWLREHLHRLHDAGGSLEGLEDPALRESSQSIPSACRRFLLLAVQCTRAAANDRPNMIQVYQALK